MNTVHLNLRGLWMFRAFSRNPLVRSSDRVEAVVAALAFVVVALLTPVACAIGTAVHDSQVSHRMEALAHLHEVTANVTADSTARIQPAEADATTPVQWTVGSVTHTGAVESRDWHRAGDTIGVWIDDSGSLSPVPPSAADPVVTAVVAALSLWIGFVVTAVAFLAVVRLSLNRRRYASWEREYKQLPEDRGRRWHH